MDWKQYTATEQIILSDAEEHSFENFIVGASEEQINEARKRLIADGLVRQKEIVVLTDKGRKLIAKRRQ